MGVPPPPDPPLLRRATYLLLLLKRDDSPPPAAVPVECMSIRICICVCACICKRIMYTHTYTYSYKYMRMYLDTYTCTCIHTHAHTYLHKNKPARPIQSPALATPPLPPQPSQTSHPPQLHSPSPTPRQLPPLDLVRLVGGLLEEGSSVHDRQFYRVSRRVQDDRRGNRPPLLVLTGNNKNVNTRLCVCFVCA